jgi:hypothetical protein
MILWVALFHLVKVCYSKRRRSRGGFGTLEFETQIFSAVDEIPPAPKASGFRVSGCSVMVYFTHRLKSSEYISARFEDGTLETIDDDRSYSAKLRPDNKLYYSTLVEAGPTPAALKGVVGSSHASRLRQSVIWFGGDYVTCAIPLLLTTPQEDRIGIELGKPMGVDDILRFLALLSDGTTSSLLGEASARSLAAAVGVDRNEIEHTWAVPASFAIQVWNMDGSDGFKSGKLYSGISDSARFAWEISAIMSHSSDHFTEDGLWMRRSPHQVYGLVHLGSCFFDDHMVFATADSCLEMAHLPAWLRDRSKFRLQQYGYDSSSIFIWSVSILRRSIMDDLAKRYRSMISELSTTQSLTAAEQGQRIRSQIVHSQVLDRAAHFRDYLIEARIRFLDERIFSLRGGERAMVSLAGDMAKCAEMAESLRHVHEESEGRRRDSLLAVLAISLAAVQIPDFVEQIDSWFANREWILLLVSLLLIMSPLLILLRALRQGKGQR